MRSLVYYTVGKSRKYIDILVLSLASLRAYSTVDILVICDESFLDECKERCGNVSFMTCPDSKTPEEASMNKLKIFSYSRIHEYDRVLFLDSDILVHTHMEPYFSKTTVPGILYVYTETKKIQDHICNMWSLVGAYTAQDLMRFRTESIHVFNAGCFSFVRSDEMKNHFANIQSMIASYKGPFFYEQSFMNVYFNKNNKTDRSLFTDNTYTFPPKGTRSYEGTLVHFAGSPGNGESKYAWMKSYLLDHLNTK